MRDISKKLTIINTGERKEKTSGTSTAQTASYGGCGGGVAIGGGLYLPKATWDKVFEIKSTSSGEEYLFGKLPIALQYGLTMYVDGEMIELPSLAQGLPFDGRTIWYNPDTNQIEVIGGTGGGSGEGVSNFWDLTGIPWWITNTKPEYKYSEIKETPNLGVYALKTDIPSLNGYATESWVLGKNYALNSDLSSLATKVNDFLEGSDTDNIINKWRELESFLSGLSESDNLANILGTKADKNYVDKTFVTIQGNEDVTGVHSFVNGLKVGDIELKKSKDDVVYLDGNLVVKGGVTMYGSESVDTPSIYDGLPVDGTTIYWEYDDEGNKTVLKAQKTDIPSTVDDKTFFYEQQTAASIWNVVHNMGKRPSVMVFDSANDEVHGDIFYNDDNRVTLTFSSSFSGVAILN